MAKKNPSTRWFFKDWHEDEGLQLCSLAARGLWIELLVICAANGGYLLVGDRIPPSVAALARFVRATPGVVRRLLRELEDNKVFSRDERGVIFCRRMVRKNGTKNDCNKANFVIADDHPQQPDLFQKPSRTRRSPARRKLSKAFKLEESESRSESESPAARAVEKINMGESSERPAGAFRDVGDAAIRRTPVGVVPAGVLMGDNDACTSLASATDYRGLDRQDQDQGSLADGAASNGAALPGAPLPGQHSDDGQQAVCAFEALARRNPAPVTNEAGAFREVGEVVKTRMPARMADRHRDGVNDAYTSQAPAADNRGLARECQDHANPLAGGGQSATVGLPRPGFDCRPAPRADRPRPRTKTPALRGKIRDQLQAKHGRFLVACRPQREVEAYWSVMLGDDPAEAQRVFDATDRRMRAMRWDDTREVAA